MPAQELQKTEPARTPEHTRARQVVPAVDIYENPTELLVLADFPGVEPDAVSVRLDPPEFHIEGKIAGTEPEYQAVYHRAFTIDERVDPEGITAELKDGVLTVHLRKTAALQPRKIPVKAG